MLPAGSITAVMPSLVDRISQRRFSTARMRAISKCCSRAALWPKIQAAMQEQQPALNVLDLPFLEGLQSNVCANYLTPIGYESLTDTWVAK